MNILVVEDEHLALEELQHLLRTFEPAHDVQIASNGLEGLKASQMKKVDLLITDIRMPGLDGIGLIRQMKEFTPELTSIILSGYEDFEYARSGLQLGVKEYLLKPVRKQTLIDTVAAALKEREAYHKEKKQTEEWALIRSLTGEDKQHSPGIWAIILSIPGNLQSRHEWPSDWLLPAHLPLGSRVIYPDKRHQCVLIPCSNVPDALTLSVWGELIHESHASQISHVHTTSGVKKSEMSLHDAYVEACRQLSVQIRLDASTLATVGYSKPNSDFTLLWEKVRLLEIHMEARNREGMRKEIQRILHELQGMQATTIELEQFLTDMLTALGFKLTDSVSKRVAEPAEIRESVRQSSSYLELGEWVEDRLVQFTDQLKVKSTDPKNLVQLLMHRVRHVYESPDSLQQFAVDHHVSVGYLSRLFKSEVGKTFSEYVVEIRMKQAKELLELQSLSPAQVGVRLGYEDAKYFSQLFKKLTGYSPSEYQKRSRQKTLDSDL